MNKIFKKEKKETYTPSHKMYISNIDNTPKAGRRSLKRKRKDSTNKMKGEGLINYTYSQETRASQVGEEAPSVQLVEG